MPKKVKELKKKYLLATYRKRTKEKINILLHRKVEENE